MRTNVFSTRLALFLALASLSPAVVAATSVVNALLQDSSTDAAIRTMRISLDRDTVKAGRVTFRAVNQSKDQIHEVVVVRTQPKNTALPYDEKKGEVIEGRIHRLGEIPGLKPGASGAMTLSLKPGSYALICNQPGHYKAGMVANLSVRK